MKRTLIAASLLAASLSGCYVVPIDARNPPPYPAVAAAVRGEPVPVSVAPAQPQPATYQARLYPINDVAGKMGVLTAQVTDNLAGHGSFTLTAGNEILTGEASRVGSDHPGFGSIHRQVYGDTGRLPTSGRRGIGNAGGSRGTYVNCEYVLTAATQGTGACLFSNGAKYQIHFGA